MRYEPGPMTGGATPSRHVVLDGAWNVRDIGSYRIVDDPEVVRGRLLPRRLPQPADQLPDTERLDRLGLRTVVDFRHRARSCSAGTTTCPSPSSTLTCRSAAVTSAPSTSSSPARPRAPAARGRRRAGRLVHGRDEPRFRRRRQAARGVRRTLRLLCAPGRLPLLYHRTGGKDRTGWIDRHRADPRSACRVSWCSATTCCPTFPPARATRSSASTWSPRIVADPELLRPSSS